MMEDDMPMPELYTALPYTAVAVIFLTKNFFLLKKFLDQIFFDPKRSSLFFG